MTSDLKILDSPGIPERAEDVILGAVDVVPQRGDDPPPEQGPNALAACRAPLQRRTDRHYLFRMQWSLPPLPTFSSNQLLKIYK